MQPCPSAKAPWLLRIGFGLALAGLGVNHYRDIANFVAGAQGAFPTVPSVGTIAMYLAYVVPALEIAGGVLFAVGQLKCVAKICICAALGGILGWAGLAIMIDTPDMNMMGMVIHNTLMFIVGYHIIKKMSCCGSMCSTKGACGSGCMCGKK